MTWTQEDKINKIFKIINFTFFLIWPSQLIANDTKIFYSGFSFSNTYDSNVSLVGYSSQLIKEIDKDSGLNII